MRTIEARSRARDGTIALLVVTILCGCQGLAEPPDDAARRCGDGVLDAWEPCDDGNAIAGDGCSAGCAIETGPAEADTIVDAPSATGSGFHDPMRAVNGVRGGGEDMQSLDVYSIGLGGDRLVLGFSGRRLVDGPGDDLVVFENAFRYGDGLTFIDAAIVELSADGETWVTFPHDYVAEDERAYSPYPEDWDGFAGVEPVLSNADDDPIDPFDPRAGGDRFDLADLPDTPEAATIRRDGAAFVRIVAAASRTNPDTGEPFPIDVVSDGPDIDGVAARTLVEAP
jgi:cysteine-rich repeat protein